MTKPSSSQIKWGDYGGFEGPYYLGSTPLPANFRQPTRDQKILMVLTATESGKADSVNMYDAGICSIGFRQDTAQSGNLQKLLAYVNSKVPESTVELYSFLHERGYDFKPGYGNVYNFFSIHNNEPLTKSEQLAKMFLQCSGKKGTWPGGRHGPVAYAAMEFASQLVNVLSWKGAPEAQAAFAVETIYGFMAEPAKSTLLGARGKSCYSSSQVINLEAAIAIYVSFAANNPAIADRSFEQFIQRTKREFLSDEWLKELAAFMTFDPQIAIYPERYTVIRPVVEKLYSVNLPDYAGVLASEYTEYTFKTPDGLQSFNIATVKGMQGALHWLGYEVGPVDGILGRKTTTAVIEFQKDYHLDMDGKYGFKTRNKLMQALKIA